MKRILGWIVAPFQALFLVALYAVGFVVLTSIHVVAAPFRAVLDLVDASAKGKAVRT